LTTIAHALSADLAVALASIHARAFACGARAWLAGELTALAAGAGVFAVLDDDATPRGFALFRQVLDEAELLTIAVAPEHGNNGVGRALLRHGLDHLGASGCRRVFLEVAPSNAPALALYAAAGFEKVGERSRYYEETASGRAVVLRRFL
jgi:ribosomal-protein-alanine N-acetyltransferase